MLVCSEHLQITTKTTCFSSQFVIKSLTQSLLQQQSQHTINATFHIVPFHRRLSSTGQSRRLGRRPYAEPSETPPQTCDQSPSLHRHFSLSCQSTTHHGMNHTANHHRQCHSELLPLVNTWTPRHPSTVNTTTAMRNSAVTPARVT